MNREEFRMRLAQRPLVCDGPLGRILQAPHDEEESRPLPELLGLEDAQRLREIHAEALSAGADLILTNTLAATTPTLAPLGMSDRMAEIITRSLEIAREALTEAGGDALLGLALGPLAPGIAPLGALSFPNAVAAYQEVLGIALPKDPDVIVLEGMTDLQDLRAALVAIRASESSLPVIAQLVFASTGRTATGTTPAALVATARSLGADVVGASGSLPPREMRPIAKALSTIGDLPICLQPGVGGAVGKELTPKAFAGEFDLLLESGAAVIGCSSAPAPNYTAYLKRLARKHPVLIPAPTQRLVLASRGRDVEIGPERGIATAKEWGLHAQHAVQNAGTELGRAVEALYAPVLRAGVQMVEARLMSHGADEPAFMGKIVPAIQKAADRPLIITADTRKGLETALEHAVGRPLVGAVWLGAGRIERMIPLALKYGAAVIATCMTEKGVPESAEERVAVAEKIVGEVCSAGLRQEDLIIDPADGIPREEPGKVSETLRTLSLLRSELGQPTLLRLSRIGEGITHGRAGIEAAYLSLAALAGLDLVVGNLEIPALMRAAGAGSFFAGRDREARRYESMVRALEQAHDFAPHRPAAPRREPGPSERRPFRDRDERTPRRPFRERSDRPPQRPFRERSDRPPQRPFRDRDERTPRRPFRDRDERTPRRPFRERSEGAPRRPFRERDERAPRRPFRERDERATRRPFRERDERAPRRGRPAEADGPPRRRHPSGPGRPPARRRSAADSDRPPFQRRGGGPRREPQRRSGPPRGPKRSAGPPRKRKPRP